MYTYDLTEEHAILYCKIVYFISCVLLVGDSLPGFSRYACMLSVHVCGRGGWGVGGRGGAVGEGMGLGVWVWVWVGREPVIPTCGLIQYVTVTSQMTYFHQSFFTLPSFLYLFRLIIYFR